MALTKVTGQVINDSTGLVVGVTTVGGGLSATDGFFSGIVTAVGNASFSGSVSVGGTLTYEDVTNIDSVGLVTARNGIVVGSGITLSKDGDIFATGITTVSGNVKVGTGITLSPDGDIFATGITTISENLKVGTGITISPDGDGFYTGVVTATSFSGDGSNLTGLSGVSVANQSDNRLITCTGTTDALNGEANLSYSSSSSLNLTDGNGTSNLGGNYLLLKRSTGNTNYINAPLADADLLLSADENIYFNTVHTADFNSTERFRIASAGQLGIGGANYGTSGQVLQSQGSSSAPQWATPAAWVYGTAADYDQWGSLTDVEFSGWPSTWQEIRVSFINISVNSGSKIQFFVSKSSSTAARITSGYQNTSGYYGSGTGVASVQNQGQFHGTESYAYQMNGYVSFYKFSSTVIRYEGQLVNKTDTYIFHTNGFVTCDPTTSMTHIFFRGTGASYDYGQFKLDYLAS